MMIFEIETKRINTIQTYNSPDYLLILFSIILLVYIYYDINLN